MRFLKKTLSKIQFFSIISKTEIHTIKWTLPIDLELNSEQDNTLKYSSFTVLQIKKWKNMKSRAFEVPLFCDVKRKRQEAHGFWCFWIENSILSLKIPICDRFEWKMSVLERFFCFSVTLLYLYKAASAHTTQTCRHSIYSCVGTDPP